MRESALKLPSKSMVSIEIKTGLGGTEVSLICVGSRFNCFHTSLGDLPNSGTVYWARIEPVIKIKSRTVFILLSLKVFDII